MLLTQHCLIYNLLYNLSVECVYEDVMYEAHIGNQLFGMLNLKWSRVQALRNASLLTEDELCDKVNSDSENSVCHRACVKLTVLNGVNATFNGH